MYPLKCILIKSGSKWGPERRNYPSIGCRNLSHENKRLSSRGKADFAESSLHMCPKRNKQLEGSEGYPQTQPKFYNSFFSFTFLPWSEFSSGLCRKKFSLLWTKLYMFQYFNCTKLCTVPKIKKKKKKWNLCVQRDLFIWFFRIIQVRKSFFPSLPSTFSSLPQCFELHRCHLWLQICSHRSGDCKINLITFGLFLWPSLIFSYWLLLGAHWVRWHLEWTKWSNHTQLSQCHTNFYGLDKSLCIC